MNMTAKLVIGALAACTLAACGGQSNGAGGGWKIGNDTGADAGADGGGHIEPDTGVDTGTDGGHAHSYQVNFELQNDSGRAVYASPQVSGLFGCGPIGQDWLTVKYHNSSIKLRDTCDVCNCDDAQPCAICEMAGCAAPTADGSRLDDGQSRTFQWDAYAWIQRQQENQQMACEEPQSLAGKTVQAEFCYGTGFDDTTRKITGTHCQSVDVSLDQPSQTVRVTVPPPPPHDITFRLVNDTGHDVYINPGTPTSDIPCGGSWYSVGDGSQDFTLRATCGVCACSEIEQNPGQQCMQECPSCPVVMGDAQHVLPGEVRSDTWDGTIVVRDTVAGQQCQRQSVPPTNQLHATFCWSDQLDQHDGWASVHNPQCEDVAFDRQTDHTVEFHIQN